MKVVLVPIVILIITFLSEQITLVFEKSNAFTIEIYTMLLHISIKKRKSKSRSFNFYKSIRHFIFPTKYLIQNSSILYSYKVGDKHKFVLKTHVIILLISLTIFLYSKAKSINKKRIKYVG